MSNIKTTRKLETNEYLIQLENEWGLDKSVVLTVKIKKGKEKEISITLPKEDWRDFIGDM